MSQAEFKRRLKALMAKTENQVCSDCPERQPRWASLIVPPPGSPAGSLSMGAFTCLECSGSHRRLGVHIAFVRSITLDSWKEKEVLAMENGGNKKVNAIFETHLPSISNKPSLGASGPVRERFIRDKYERRKYYDPKAFAMFEGDESSSESESDEEESPPRRNVVRAPSEAARLRAQARKQSNGVGTIRAAPSGGTISKLKKSTVARTPVRNKVPVAAPATQPVVDLLDFSLPPSSNPGLGPPPNPPSASPSPTLDMFKSFQSASISNPAVEPTVSVGRGNVINNVGVSSNTSPPSVQRTSQNSTQINDKSMTPQVETKKMTSDDILAMFHAPSPQGHSQAGMVNAFGNFAPSGMNNGVGRNMNITNQNVSQLMMMNGMAPNSNNNNMMMNTMMNMNGNAINGMQSQGANQMQQFSSMQHQQFGGMKTGNAGTMNSNSGMHALQQSQMPQHNMQPQFNIAMDPPTSMQAPMGGTSSNLNVMGGGGSGMSNNFANFHQQHEKEQNIAMTTSVGGNKSSSDKNPQMDQFASFASFH